MEQQSFAHGLPSPRVSSIDVVSLALSIIPCLSLFINPIPDISYYLFTDDPPLRSEPLALMGVAFLAGSPGLPSLGLPILLHSR